MTGPLLSGFLPNDAPDVVLTRPSRRRPESNAEPLPFLCACQCSPTRIFVPLPQRSDPLLFLVALRRPAEALHAAPVDEEVLDFAPPPQGEEVLFDYASLGLTLRGDPLALLRPALEARRLMTAAELEEVPDGRLVRYAGIVTLRQQPEMANGTIFISLEDETGAVQVICWRSLRDLQRRKMLKARLLAVYGKWQREGDVKS